MLFAIAVGTYWLLVRRVMGANDFLQILLTEGISLALIGAAQLAFGADYRQINLHIANRITSLGPLHFSVGYILSFAVSLALVIALQQFLSRTEMGRAIRAVAQNRTVAPLMGIRVERVSAITFGLGIACAGVAGALLLPIFWTNPTVGGPYTLKSFVIVVLGGMGSVQGAALGGLLLGVAEQFTAYTWADRYAEVVDFVLFLAGAALPAPGPLRGEGHMSRLPSWWPTVVFFVVLTSMPLWLHDGYLLQLVFRVVVFAVLGMAWNFVGGYAGQLSLGHVAYFGIGAYAMTSLHRAHRLEPLAGGGARGGAGRADGADHREHHLPAPRSVLRPLHHRHGGDHPGAGAEPGRAHPRGGGDQRPAPLPGPGPGRQVLLRRHPAAGRGLRPGHLDPHLALRLPAPGHPGEREHRDGGGREPGGGQAPGACSPARW